MAEGYVVEIKRSARRINEAASAWVGGRGSTRRFDSKAAARAWAASASDGDDGAVRVQDAAPNDPAPVDGYLVADPVRRRERRAEVDVEDPERLDTFEPRNPS